ncbi:hypothetical protein [Aeromonas hydrophila]|uniref:hypothetical protein n=1 Tax=Aeromonas hydrophila TaxID=644 RepID=UPI003EC89879
MIEPFSNRSEAGRQALIAQILFNQNITKKSQFVPYTELFPYLQDNPSWLDDDRIKKAQKVLNTLQTEAQLSDFRSRIAEEFEIEDKNKDKDKFYLNRIRDLYQECDRRFQAEQLKQLNKGEKA